MKLAVKKSEVSVQGSMQTSSFGLSLNGKAFRTLSDKLYTNKIGSLVREIASNAMDAHIASGSPEKPITIYLPTDFDPHFVVKDTGTGIDPKNIVSVYCTMFESTKENTNSQVGAYGLGSKTPYAYTDSFVVENIYKGKKYLYSMFLDESGIPTTSLMGAYETNEPNGLSVKVPVERNDFYKFKNEVSTQLRYFDVLPIVANVPDFEFPKLSEILIDYNGVKVFKNNTSRYTGMTIVQGGVGYPVSYHDVSSLIDSSNIQIFGYLYDNGAVLTFDIGEIDIPPTRENIELSTFTIDNLNKRLTDFKIGLKLHVDSFFKGLTLNEKLVLLNESHEIKNLANYADYDLSQYEKYRYGRSYGYKFDSVFQKIVQQTSKANDGTVTKFDTTKVMFTKQHYSSSNFDNVIRKEHDSPMNFIKATSSKQTVLLRNTTSKPMTRLKYYMTENNIKDIDVIVVGYSNDDSPNDAFNKKVLKQFNSVSSEFKFIGIDTLPEPPKNTKASYTRAITTGYSISSDDFKRKYASITSVSLWDKLIENVKDIEPSVYVSTDRYDVIEDYENLTKMQLLIHAGIYTGDIFGFNQKVSEKIEKMDDWVKLGDFVSENWSKIETRLDKIAPIIQMLEYKKAIRNFNNTCVYDLYKHIDLITNKDFKHLVKTIVKVDLIYDRMLKKESEFTRIVRLGFSRFIDSNKQQLSENMSNNINKFNKMVEKLYFIEDYICSNRHYYDEKHTIPIIEYVNWKGEGV
jgi:hypothetical protein